MGIKSCFGCEPPKRNPTCHDSCPEYIAEKEQDEKEKEKERIKRKVSRDIYQQRALRVEKAKKKHGKI